MVERYPYKVDVTGSSPVIPTIFFGAAAVVQLVRIPACHAGGRGFESRPLRHIYSSFIYHHNILYLCYYICMKLKSALFTLYIAVWLILAIDPWYRDDWLLENLLVFIALPIILWCEKRFGFSEPSVWMLFIFFVLHGIGAHYTYSEMPFFTPFTEFFGFERNHYDRVIHFLFGFLLFLPFLELFFSFEKSVKNTFTFTLVFLIAASGFYEVIEWIATQMTHADLGTAFLGIQGDEWDAQKDMACGYLGVLISAAIYYRKIIPKH